METLANILAKNDPSTPYSTPQGISPLLQQYLYSQYMNGQQQPTASPTQMTGGLVAPQSSNSGISGSPMSFGGLGTAAGSTPSY